MQVIQGYDSTVVNTSEAFSCSSSQDHRHGFNRHVALLALRRNTRTFPWSDSSLLEFRLTYAYTHCDYHRKLLVPMMFSSNIQPSVHGADPDKGLLPGRSDAQRPAYRLLADADFGRLDA